MKKLSRKDLEDLKRNTEDHLLKKEKYLEKVKSIISLGFFYYDTVYGYIFQFNNLKNKTHIVYLNIDMVFNLRGDKEIVTIKAMSESDLNNAFETIKEFANYEIEFKSKKFYGDDIGDLVLSGDDLFTNLIYYDHFEIMIYPSAKNKNTYCVFYLNKDYSDSDLPSDFAPFSNITKIRKSFTKCTIINTYEPKSIS